MERTAKRCPVQGDSTSGGTCLPQGPPRRWQYSCESLRHSTSRTRSKHVWKIVWSTPERALLNACWEQRGVSVIGSPMRKRRSVKKPSSDAEIESFVFLSRSFITVQKGSFPLFLEKAPLRLRACSRTSGSSNVEQNWNYRV